MTLLRWPMAFVRLLVQSVLLALGQIWANKTRSILTTVGIIIGVASVTAVIAGLTGLKTKVLNDFASLGTNRIQAWPTRPDSGPMRRVPMFKIKFTPEQFDDLLENCPSIAALSRLHNSVRIVAHGTRVIEDAQVIGIEPPWHTIENRSVLQGRPFLLVDIQEARKVCLVTAIVRDKLQLDRECVGEEIAVGNSTYRVVGLVEPPVKLDLFGMGQQGNPMEVFIPFTAAYRTRWDWMSVAIAAKSPEVAEEAKAELSFFLRRTRNQKPGELDTFHVETVARMLDKFDGISKTITAVAGGIVGISLLVGGIGIMNIMLVSVSERTREIGLRKAVGARPSAILLQFLVEAVVLCLAGGVIGILVGQCLTLGIAKIPKAQLEQAYIPLWAILLALGFSTAVGLTFGMFPAIKAARMDPIEALRHE